MEIGPLPAIRSIPTSKTLREDPRLTGFLDIEQITAPKEDTFSSGGEQTAGGQDDGAPEEEPQEQPAEETAAEDSGSTMSLFA